MVSIVVCDDQNDFRDVFSDKLNRLLSKSTQDYELHLYGTGHELSNAVQRGQHIDILFLDIRMPGINGKEVARKLRTQNKRFKLVFVSSYEKEVWEVFEYDVAAFLRKCEVDQKLPPLLQRLLAELEDRRCEVLIVDTFEGREKNRTTIYRDDILYFETRPGSKEILVHVAARQEPYSLGRRLTLHDVHVQISASGFVQVDRSYIVNLENVRTHDRQSVIMDSGAVVPLSRRRRPEFEQAFFSYLGASANKKLTLLSCPE